MQRTQTTVSFLFVLSKRRNSDYVGNRMMRLKLPGNRLRRKTRLVDIVKEDMRVVSVSEEDEEDVEDKVKCKQMICSGDL